LFCIVEVVLLDIDDELVEEDGDVLEDEVLDGDVLEDELLGDDVLDGAVLDGYCELLEDGVEDDDGLDDELGELVWANAPPHRPAAQSSVMILVR
jgi:hypothetical protein